MSTNENLRFAVIGAGVIGNVHSHALNNLDGVELAAIADVDESKAEAMAAQFDVPSFTADVDALLNRDDIDAVCICTPSGLHADVTVAALTAGKHVIVEKPIDISLDAADRIIAAEKSSGKKVAVVSQHRFDKSTEKVMAAVRAGNLGTITSAIASHAWWRGQSYYDSGDWRGTWAMDGGGAIMNQTVHTINLMVTLLGTPVEVFAYTACLAHDRIEVEDTAVAVVKFSSGALGVIHGTTAAYPGLDASLRVFGSKGSAIISNDELTFFHENADAAPEILMPDAANPPNQITADDKLTAADQSLGKGHQAQLADFADVIRTDGTVRVGTVEARTSLSVILALYESAATGNPVSL
jgi:UDP-N-acetyl-2-amino-2-deoxyglucuronate dehydrogenase